MTASGIDREAMGIVGLAVLFALSGSLALFGLSLTLWLRPGPRDGA